MPLLLQQLAIKLASAAPEASSRLLGGDISLRLSHQLVSNEEFADGGRPEEGRVKVHMEPAGLGFFLGAVQRRLVDPGAWFC